MAKHYCTRFENGFKTAQAKSGRHRKFASVLAGSLLFWGPTIILRATIGPDWTVLVLPLSLLLPLWMCLGFHLASDVLTIRTRVLACAVLLGIWSTGPFWMIVENSFTPGEGFHQAGSILFLIWTTALFPITTFIMATYGGTLFALIGTTILLPIYPCIRSRFSKPQITTLGTKENRCS